MPSSFQQARQTRLRLGGWGPGLELPPPHSPCETLPFFTLSLLYAYTTPVIGKAEGTPNDFHGHVTALTVAPEYRRLSLARTLMNFLETASDDVYGGFFVDLYVRCTNSIAVDLYEGLGYSVYRRVREYYGSLGLGPGGKDEEDAFGSCPSSFSITEDWLFVFLTTARSL